MALQNPSRSGSHMLGPILVATLLVACASDPSEGTPGASSTGSPDASSNSTAGTSGSGSSGAGGSDAAGSGGFGGGTAPPDYNPCAGQAAPCVLLPLGDSITYGDQSTDQAGYRSRLFHLALQAKQSITFVGGQTNGPETVDGVAFPKTHEGHTGYAIDQIQPFTAESIKTFKPQMVLLEIGTNDFAFEDPTDSPARLGTLVDTILAADPKLLLIVAQITPTQDDTINEGIKRFNATIPQMVSTRVAAGKHITIVDMYGALTADADFKTTKLANKWHPNDAGYAKMAATWYAKVGSLFSK